MGDFTASPATTPSPPTYRMKFNFLKSRGTSRGKILLRDSHCNRIDSRTSRGHSQKISVLLHGGGDNGKKEHAPPNPASTCPRLRSHIALSEKLVLGVGQEGTFPESYQGKGKRAG